MIAFLCCWTRFSWASFILCRLLLIQLFTLFSLSFVWCGGLVMVLLPSDSHSFPSLNHGSNGTFTFLSLALLLSRRDGVCSALVRETLSRPHWWIHHFLCDCSLLIATRTHAHIVMLWIDLLERTKCNGRQLSSFRCRFLYIYDDDVVGFFSSSYHYSWVASLR